jgi:hypothetical protein
VAEPIHADDLGYVPLDGDPFVRVPAGYSMETRLEQRRIQANRAALRSAYPSSILDFMDIRSDDQGYRVGVWPK